MPKIINHILIEDLIILCRAKSNSNASANELLNYLVLHPELKYISDLKTKIPEIKSKYSDAFPFLEKALLSLDKRIKGLSGVQNPESIYFMFEKSPIAFDETGHTEIVTYSKEKFLTWLQGVKDKSLAVNLPIDNLTGVRSNQILSKLECSYGEKNQKLNVATIQLLASTVSWKLGNNLSARVGIIRKQAQQNVVDAIMFHDMMATINLAVACEQGVDISETPNIFDYQIQRKLEIVESNLVSIAEAIRHRSKFILHPVDGRCSIVKSIVRGKSGRSINIDFARRRLIDIIAYYTPLAYLEAGITNEQEVIIIGPDKKLVRTKGTPIHCFFTSD